MRKTLDPLIVEAPGYSRELVQAALDYLENYKQAGDPVPNLAGMAHYMGTTKAQVNAWLADEDKPELLLIVQRLDTLQEKRLLRDSLLGNFNQTIAKLMLARFGYVERSQTDMTSSDGSVSALVKVSFVTPDHGNES